MYKYECQCHSPLLGEASNAKGTRFQPRGTLNTNTWYIAVELKGDGIRRRSGKGGDVGLVNRSETIEAVPARVYRRVEGTKE
jgi:hypothetical protein